MQSEVSKAWQLGARAGYVASGVLHILIGVLALLVAFGGSDQEADQSGALETVAGTPFGTVALWVVIVALVALGAWQIAVAIRRPGSGGDRAKAGAKGAVYLALAATAFAVVSRGQASSEDQTESMTAKLMSQPGGRWLVGVVGAAIIGVAVYHVVKGLRRKFLEDLQALPRERAGRVVITLGVLGYVAKGAALLVVGGLFIAAAREADPEKAGGLDGALRTVQDAPGGPILLALVALGFLAYGLYSFVRARYGRL